MRRETMKGRSKAGGMEGEEVEEEVEGRATAGHDGKKRRKGWEKKKGKKKRGRREAGVKEGEEAEERIEGRRTAGNNR